MQGIHDAKSATKWLEGQVVSYLYGGTDEHSLSRCVTKLVSTYKVSPQDIKSLFTSVESNLTTYYGGRYRLAYGAMGRRFGETSFTGNHQKKAIMQSLGNVSRTIPNSR
ncbi:MAG: hypothetical protein JRM91_03970 [Nitrososphaerota archaeon]|jgi:hypothetical protein|nr:hypothetical protein [Nitrososphaerota archaeon]